MSENLWSLAAKMPSLDELSLRIEMVTFESNEHNQFIGKMSTTSI